MSLEERARAEYEGLAMTYHGDDSADNRGRLMRTAAMERNRLEGQMLPCIRLAARIGKRGQLTKGAFLALAHYLFEHGTEQ